MACLLVQGGRKQGGFGKGCCLSKQDHLAGEVCRIRTHLKKPVRHADICRATEPNGNGCTREPGKENEPAQKVAEGL